MISYTLNVIIQHPLCSGEMSAVRLRLHFSADALEAVHEQCQHYSDIIREQMDTRERERLDKVGQMASSCLQCPYLWLQLEAVRAKARKELQQRREEAIKDAQRIKSECVVLIIDHLCMCIVCAVAEEAGIAALKEKKQALLKELQQQMKMARAVS